MTQEDKWFHALSLIIMKEKKIPKYHLLSAYSFLFLSTVLTKSKVFTVYQTRKKNIQLELEFVKHN